MKATAQSYTDHLNFARCGRIRRRNGAVSVELDERGQASFSGLCLCNNVHECPTCDLRLSYLKRRQLQLVVEAHRAAGGFVYMNTNAPRHHGGHSLATVHKALAAAFSFALSGAPWKRKAASIGFLGLLRDREITVSRVDGWHVHDHTALFTSRRLSGRELDDLGNWWFERWSSKLVRCGLPAPTRERGVDIRYLRTDNRNYLVKLGLESELTLSATKRGRAGDGDEHFTMQQVLERIAIDRPTSEGVDAWFVDRWREFAAYMPGKTKHRWSHGEYDLRKRYGVEKDLKKLPAEPEREREPGEEYAEAQTLYTFDADTWDNVIRRNVRVQLAILDAAESGAGAERIRAIVDAAVRQDLAA